ncbi:MAG TPA: maleylacetoacetate isomerase [Beijerinckiaceae bacterium]|nr:maleylacetoacetate isomerase [Beijerinckiaceae bacterium]
MAETIKFYGFWRSIASFRVRVALRLKALPFEEIAIDLMAGAQFSPDYARLNPQHVLPTLLYGGATLFQSMAIMEYLDELHPEPGLLPKTAADRAYARALALIAVADSHPLIVPRVRRHLSETYGCDEAAIHQWAAHWTAKGLETYEALLTRRRPAPFAVGDSVSLADICIASQIVAAGFFGVALGPYPTAAALGERCFALPAFADSHPRRQPGAPSS